MDTSASSSSANSNSASSSSFDLTNPDLTNPDIITQFRKRAEIETARKRQIAEYVKKINTEFGYTQCIICNEFIQPISNNLFIHVNSHGKCYGKFHGGCLKWLLTPNPQLSITITDCPNCNEKFTETEIDQIFFLEKCAICLVPLGEKGVFTPECGHTLHIECAQQAHKHNINCPLCRTPNKFIVIEAPPPPPPPEDEDEDEDPISLRFEEFIRFIYIDPNINVSTELYINEIIFYYDSIISTDVDIAGTPMPRALAPDNVSQLINTLISYIDFNLTVSYNNTDWEINLNNFLGTETTITDIFLQNLTQFPVFLTIPEFNYSPFKFFKYDFTNYNDYISLNNFKTKHIVIMYCTLILRIINEEITKPDSDFNTFIQSIQAIRDNEDLIYNLIKQYIDEHDINENDKKIFVLVLIIYINYYLSSDENIGHTFAVINYKVTIDIYVLCTPIGIETGIIGTQIYRRKPDSIWSRIMGFNPFGRRGGKKRKFRKTKKRKSKKAKKGTHKRP
jgi:hypothetical protein